jgi:L-asparaginase
MAGAVVCMADEVHAARWVSKVDAAGPPAFTSAPYPPIARVLLGPSGRAAAPIARVLLGPSGRAAAPIARVVGPRLLPVGAPPPRPPRATGEPATDVALIKTYPGMDGTLLTAAVDAGAAGIVLEGTGAGNVPASLLATISDLTEWKIPVVVASRCRTGDLDLPDLGLGATLAAGVGAIGSRGLSAPKARLALMVALGSGSAAGARAWFSEL